MSNCSDRRQRGNALMEALVGVFIMAVIGAGTAQIAARIAVGQRELRVEGIAVAQLRQMLVTQGPSLCGSTDRKVLLPDDVEVTVENVVCASDPPKITVTPDSRDPAVDPALEVDAVKPVTMRVRLTNLKVQAGTGDAEIEVGTRS